VVAPETPANRAHIAALKGLPWIYETPEEAVERFAAAELAPFAPIDELRHWVLSGLTQQEDGRWTWRLDPVVFEPGPPGRLTQTEEMMWQLLGQVRCPTLLVRGVDTVALPLELAEQIMAIMPDARIVTLADAGHWTPLDNPAGFVAVVRDFLGTG
jgi:pimeloyl-ACP methyl ester carboxylesterase